MLRPCCHFLNAPECDVPGGAHTVEGWPGPGDLGVSPAGNLDPFLADLGIIIDLIARKLDLHGYKPCDLDAGLASQIGSHNVLLEKNGRSQVRVPGIFSRSSASAVARAGRRITDYAAAQMVIFCLIRYGSDRMRF